MKYFLGFIALLCSPAIAQPPTPALQALKAVIQPLATTGLPANDTDLLPLDRWLNGKNLIAMGEASHAASEFFRMKARMFRYLAEHHGFRVFALESTLGSTYALNRFLVDGVGDKRIALSRLDNGFWDSAEVLDLVDWMRAWNVQHREPADQLLFLGFDVNTPAAAADCLKEFLQQVDPAFYTAHQSGFSQKILAGGAFFQEVRDRMAQQRSAYVQQSSLWTFCLAERGFVNIEQARLPHAFRYAVRDKSMADNVSFLKDNFGPKVFIWAHNYHIAEQGWNGPQCMGGYLSDLYGEDYYSIGFDFQEGEIWAKKGATVLEVLLHGNKTRRCTTHVPKAKSTYFTWYLEQAEQDLFFMDLGELSSRSDWWAKKLSAPMRMHFTDEWFARRKEYPKIMVPDTYDALIFIKAVSPTEHFRYGKRL